jgi:TonB family protein
MTSHQLLAEWSQWFWPVFANHLWQATLFAFVVWVAALWLGQARTRHTVWLMAFAKFLLPSALLFLMAQPGKTPSTARVKMTFNSPDNETPRETEAPKKHSTAGQAQSATGPIEQMSVSLRPTILYREKAQYTKEAKDNKVEGTVVLSAVFGADGQIGDIRVIRGLPDGLTENAITAANKIRFEPAMKNGQPVSVRGSIEFTFSLYKDPIRQMDSSLRPTILYREEAQYTQEAKDNKVEGTVVLSAVFGADGQVGDIRVIRGLPHGLTQKAIEAVSKIRFEPAMKDGRPVSVRGSVEFDFRFLEALR